MEWNWDTVMPRSFASSSHENGGDNCSILGFSDMVEEGAVLSGEAMIGLKLGRASPCSSPIVKRSRGSYQSSYSARCQVEGCNLDLASAKDYHRRHRICADHSKCPKVVVAGMERRFCQQCSRLHDLSEFDDRKRSCRRRLSAHNARRRRPQSENTSFSSTHRKAYMSFLVDRVSTPFPDSTPQSPSNFNSRSLDVIPSGSLLNRSSSFHGVTPRNVNHDVGFSVTSSSTAKISIDFIFSGENIGINIWLGLGLETNSNTIYAMEVRHAFSLQTTTSWGFNDPEEPSSFDQFIHGHNIDLTQSEMSLEQQNNRNAQIPPQDFDCFCSD